MLSCPTRSNSLSEEVANQELLRSNEYLAAVSGPERGTLREIGRRAGRKASPE